MHEIIVYIYIYQRCSTVTKNRSYKFYFFLYLSSHETKIKWESSMSRENARDWRDRSGSLCVCVGGRVFPWLLLLLYRDQGISYYTQLHTHTQLSSSLFAAGRVSSSLVAFDLNFAHCVTLKMSCCVSRAPATLRKETNKQNQHYFLLFRLLSSASKVNPTKIALNSIVSGQVFFHISAVQR